MYLQIIDPVFEFRKYLTHENPNNSPVPIVSSCNSFSFILLIMPSIFPSRETLNNLFPPVIVHDSRPNPATRQSSTSTPEPRPKRTPLQARPELYTAWSVVDDAKNRANALSAEARKEFEKGSAKALGKTSTIELYSPTYYAACVMGGLLACVSAS